MATPMTPVAAVPEPPPPATVTGPPGPFETSPVFYLGLAYAVIALFLMVQLTRLVYYRHKVQSFQFAFLLLLFIWEILRATYFLGIAAVQKDKAFGMLLYWIPINIQFAIFSLMVVFYASLQHRHTSQWRTFKWRYLAVWGLVNVLLFALAFVWYGLGLQSEDLPAWLLSAHEVFTGVLFFLLVCVLAWYGVRVAKLMRKSEFDGRGSHGQTRFVARLSFRKILFVTFSLFLCFTSRSFYDFFASFRLVQLNFSGYAHGETGFLVLLAFSAWEVIPSILVLLLFGSVQKTNLGGFCGDRLKSLKHDKPVARDEAGTPLPRSVQAGANVNESHDDADYPPSTYTRAAVRAPQPTDSLLRASLFADPNRYDSDSDVSPFQPNSGGFSPVFYSGAPVPSPYSTVQGST